MNWIYIDDYPLDKDFSGFISAFAQQGIELRTSKEGQIQKLWIREQCATETMMGYILSVADNDHPPSAEDIQFTINLPLMISAYKQPSLIEQATSTPVSVLLILFSLLGALLVEFGTRDGLINAFWFLDLQAQGPATLGATLSSGDIWRMITPIFIHFGLFHVLFNSLWVWDFGRRLELMMGSLGLALFVVVTGAASNIAQFLWNESPFFGGMSGVVYALVGFIGVRQWLAPHPLLHVPKAILLFMLGWLVLCMTGIINVFIDGGIANAAHLGGLIAGAIYALVTQTFYRTHQQ